MESSWFPRYAILEPAMGFLVARPGLEPGTPRFQRPPRQAGRPAPLGLSVRQRSGSLL